MDFIYKTCDKEMVGNYRTGFDSDGLAQNSDGKLLLLLALAIEIILIVSYIGVVFSFIGSLIVRLLSF